MARLIILAALFVIFPFSLSAHMPDRPDLNDWFGSLASKKGMCCSFADGVSVSDVEWDTKDGHYRVFMCFYMPQDSHSSDKLVPCADKQWVDVPDNAVVTEANRYGPAVVWPMYENSGNIGIRCFMPGAGT